MKKSDTTSQTAETQTSSESNGVDMRMKEYQTTEKEVDRGSPPYSKGKSFTGVDQPLRVLPDFMERSTPQRSEDSFKIKPMELRPVSTQSSSVQELNVPSDQPSAESIRKPTVKMKAIYLPQDKQKTEVETEVRHKKIVIGCVLFVFLRTLALILLICASIVVVAFPCLRFKYHVPIFLAGKVGRSEVRLPFKSTCQPLPLWWMRDQEFVNSLITKTGYYRALNKTMWRKRKHFNLFEDAKSKQLLRPFKGQMFVISGCVILALPMLLILIIFPCACRKDYMDEAMFDLVEISLFVVFAVVQYYLATSAEIRHFMEVLCIRYLDRSLLRKYARESVYKMCMDIRITAYGFIAAGSMFIFLVLLLAVDLIILLKKAEKIASQKYLQMAACLHYSKALVETTDLGQEVRCT